MTKVPKCPSKTLNSFGFCASNNDIRQFMGSVATSEVGKIRDGVYYPTGITKRTEGARGNLIQEGEDNIDINTNTIET